MILHATETAEGPPVALLHGLFGSGRNFGTIQRALASRFRVISLDLRNHGASPHAPDMHYPVLAGDVLETLEARSALPVALIGHSMGGKTAMAAALLHPEAIGRLIVADIAPVPYQHSNAKIAAAMLGLPLAPGLTRAQAEVALEEAVPEASVRRFLVQNLNVGNNPRWRIGLAEIAEAMPGIEGWDIPATSPYPGPALFVSGARSDFVLPEHRAGIRSLFPRARFVTLKNAGHWLHADDPEGFISVTQSFLSDWNGAP